MDAMQFWAGDFGDEYTARNWVDWRLRVPFWANILRITGARNVHEVGANAGWNLSAIKEANRSVIVSGSDVNALAVHQARSAYLDVNKEGYYASSTSRTRKPRYVTAGMECGCGGARMVRCTRGWA